MFWLPDKGNLLKMSVNYKLFNLNVVVLYVHIFLRTQLHFNRVNSSCCYVKRLATWRNPTKTSNCSEDVKFWRNIEFCPGKSEDLCCVCCDVICLSVTVCVPNFPMSSGARKLDSIRLSPSWQTSVYLR